MDYKQAFDGLYQAMNDARKAGERERTICKHNVMQYDTHGELLPCAFPNCPMGVPYPRLVRAMRNKLPSFSFSRDLDPSKSVAYSHEYYDRVFVESLADYAPRLYLWVTQKQIEADAQQRREEMQRASAESQKWAEMRQVLWVAKPWWKRAAIKSVRTLAEACSSLSWRLGRWESRL